MYLNTYKDESLQGDNKYKWNKKCRKTKTKVGNVKFVQSLCVDWRPKGEEEDEAVVKRKGSLRCVRTTVSVFVLSACLMLACLLICCLAAAHTRNTNKNRDDTAVCVINVGFSASANK